VDLGRTRTKQILSMSLIEKKQVSENSAPQCGEAGSWRIFALYSPILSCVWNLPDARVCDFTVKCKVCHENIPAPVQTMPDTWIVAECPLCGGKRRYLPTDIFRGTLSHLVAVRLQRSGRRAG
jgi:hypothetical protein